MLADEIKIDLEKTAKNIRKYMEISYDQQEKEEIERRYEVLKKAEMTERW